MARAHSQRHGRSPALSGRGAAHVHFQGEHGRSEACWGHWAVHSRVHLRDDNFGDIEGVEGKAMLLLLLVLCRGRGRKHAVGIKRVVVVRGCTRLGKSHHGPGLERTVALAHHAQRLLADVVVRAERVSVAGRRRVARLLGWLGDPEDGRGTPLRYLRPVLARECDDGSGDDGSHAPRVVRSRAVRLRGIIWVGAVSRQDCHTDVSKSQFSVPHPNHHRVSSISGDETNSRRLQFRKIFAEDCCFIFFFFFSTVTSFFLR